MTKHTMGPWIFNGHPHGARFEVFGNDGVVVAVCEFGEEDLIPDLATALANARLIVAAPELLKYLDMLVRFCEDAPRVDYNEDRVLSWLGIVTQDVRRLIARVGGCEVPKHTPGPWFWCEDLEQEEVTVRTVGDHRIICRMGWDVAGDRKTKIANARLIAEAPKMWERLYGKSGED